MFWIWLNCSSSSTQTPEKGTKLPLIIHHLRVSSSSLSPYSTCHHFAITSTNTTFTSSVNEHTPTDFCFWINAWSSCSIVGVCLLSYTHWHLVYLGFAQLNVPLSDPPLAHHRWFNQKKNIELTWHRYFNFLTSSSDRIWDQSSSPACLQRMQGTCVCQSWTSSPISDSRIDRRHRHSANSIFEIRTSRERFAQEVLHSLYWIVGFVSSPKYGSCSFQRFPNRNVADRKT